MNKIKNFAFLSLMLLVVVLMAACSNGGVDDSTLLNRVTGNVSINGTNTSSGDSDVYVKIFDDSDSLIASTEDSTGSYSAPTYTLKDIPVGSGVYTIKFKDSNYMANEKTENIVLKRGKTNYTKDLNFNEVDKISISGSDSITIPGGGNIEQETYTKTVEDEDNNPSSVNTDVSWKLDGDPAGVSIS